MRKRKHTSFSNRYRQIGLKMLAAAYRLRAGVEFKYGEYPGLLEEITRSLSGRVLDVGAAGGWVVDYLRRRKRETFGIDTDAANLKGPHLAVASVDALPFPDKTFDGVFAGFCFTYFEDKEAALAEIARVTMPLGDLVMLVHHPDSDIRKEHKKFLKYYEDNLETAAKDPQCVKQFTLSSAFIAGLMEDEDELRAHVARAGYRIRSLRVKEGRKGHLFSSIVMKDIPVRMMFWSLRASRELEE